MSLIKNASVHASSPLLLLRRIRDVMAQSLTAQRRLDQVVAIIADGFASEVCSVYLLRAGDILELFASKGLKAASVHLTRLQVGQGLVGTIAAAAEPLNLADAESHPKFEYRPETGEEVYRSFIGAPILQGGRAIGVLVVQSKEAKPYSDDQMEVMQTVAMVLSELAVSGQLVDAQEIKTATGGLAVQQLSGARLSPGMARAAAVLHQPQLTITRYVASDARKERERLDAALRELQGSFDRYLQSSGLPDEDEQRQIIEAYLLFTQDRGWIGRMTEAIASGLTAEAAVKKVQEELQARMTQTASPYIKERIQDVEEFSNHLLHRLLGKPAAPEPHELPAEFILVARSLGPAELLDYDAARLKGLILEEGSVTGHTAVIARAMDIPALGRVEQATTLIRPGDPLILDAEGGNVYIRPGDSVEQAMDSHLAECSLRAAEYEKLRGVAAVTRDGTRISLNVNAGLFVDAAAVLQEGVDGIGLYRTELPYMTARDFPGAEAQRQLYAGVYAQLPGRRVVFRSFDMGGDKRTPYLHVGEEENPAMGWRATRIGLDRPSLLREQFRALIDAAAGRALDVMLPFIAQVAEFDAARRLFDQELARAEVRPAGVRMGVMIEIPSLLWQLDALMTRVDFVSIGSNDLMQFLFACDRGAAHLAGRYDALSPVMLGVVRQVADAGRAHGVEVGFCGEMARNPLDALALIGSGIENLSAPASAIGSLKCMIRSVTLSGVRDYLASLAASPQSSLRQLLADYARDHGIAT